MDSKLIDLIRQNMHHSYRFLPTATVFRGSSDVSPIASDPQHLDELAFVDGAGEPQRYPKPWNGIIRTLFWLCTTARSSMRSIIPVWSPHFSMDWHPSPNRLSER